MENHVEHHVEHHLDALPLDPADAPTGYDPGRAAAALAALRPAIAATPPRPIRTLSFADAAIAASRLHAVASDLAPRLAALPAAEFPPDSLANLERAAWAAWHLDATSRPAQPQSRAIVPPALWDAVVAHRRHLLDTLAFALRGHAAAQATLAEIRSGSGYLDAARDLVQLADLHRTHAAELAARLPLDFDRRDSDRALMLADDLRQALGLGPALVPGDDSNARFWGYFVRVFNDVRAAIAFLWRHDTASVAALPNLAARKRQVTKSTPNSAPTPNPEPTP